MDFFFSKLTNIKSTFLFSFLYMFTILYLLYNETHERLVKSLFLAYIYNLFPVYDVTMNLSFISRRYRETVRLDLSKKTVWDFIYRPTVLNLFF